jgi:glycerol-3-phosphate acyltransferase PlsY
MPSDLSLLGFVGAALLGYLLGSIPFGLIVTRLAGTADIRGIGSGNIGMTNVLRTGRKDLAALTLLGDAGKGAVAVWLAGHFFGPNAALIAGLAAFLGHLYPVWLGFKGGKGVATYLGVLIAVDWRVALIFAVLWIAVALLTRYSSLSGLVAGTATLIALLLLREMNAALLFLVLTALLFFTLRGNIGRLLAGTERRLGDRDGPGA